MGKHRIELTQELAHELLDYTPHTGELRWRKRDRGWFGSDNACNAWNAKHAGKPALTHRAPHGCLCGSIFDTSHLAHRVIWLWMTGEWPQDQIDHRNRKPWDNRWTNLRDVTSRENMRNQSMQSRNRSDHLGVRQRCGHWEAMIGVKRKSIYLGTYKNKAEAVAAREAAERRYGFSKGHGRIRIERIRSK